MRPMNEINWKSFAVYLVVCGWLVYFAIKWLGLEALVFIIPAIMSVYMFYFDDGGSATIL